MGRPRLQPGELVTASIKQDRVRVDGTGDFGKFRPGVLVETHLYFGQEYWWVMGLTTLTHYRDGVPRVPCPQQAQPSLGPDHTFLWGPDCARVPPSDMGAHIGWATNELIDAIAKLTGRSDWEVEPMRPHNRRKR
jgi:hypothetical protein